ncbi:sialate O-acetylesterase [Sorangium sp. So ce131]|uniref:sialate O-acetylesterase n=1 Tax=Sorangium sp. So ce131 TaxID=3133282 RepID=UPI003F6414D6
MKWCRIALAAGVLSLSTPAPAQPVKVFVLAGQSNMVGYGVGAELPAELESQPDVWYDHYNPDAREGGIYAAATSDDWGPLEPKGEAHRYGPEITFGRAMAEAYPQHRIAIVKMAQGGTNIVGHWGRGLAPDPEALYKSQLYHALLGALDSATYAGDNALLYPGEATRLDRALARLQAEGHEHEIAGLIWMQGENEAAWAGGLDYGDTLRGFITALRQDLGLPELRVVLGRVSDNLYPANGGPVAAGREMYIDAVRAAQVEIAEADPHIAWVDTDDLTPRRADDTWHFDSASYQRLGRRFADAYLALAGEGGSSSASSGNTGGGGAGGADAGGGSGGGADETSSAGGGGASGDGAGSGSAGAAGEGAGAGSGGAGGGIGGVASASTGAGAGTVDPGSVAAVAGNCGCRTAGGPSRGPTAALAVLALLVLRRRRR